MQVAFLPCSCIMNVSRMQHRSIYQTQSTNLEEMKLDMLELVHAFFARFSFALIVRLPTSDVTSTLNEAAETLKAFGLASSSMTWKVVTGSNLYVPVPRDSKLNKAATIFWH
jgi:hypothetical protein